MTASVLAGELGLALLQVRLDGLITKYMGETAARLRQVFRSDCLHPPGAHAARQRVAGTLASRSSCP